ncbi:MAG: hypothetical protein QW299_02690 [Candidatus Caldarchaeum sp.]
MGFAVVFLILVAVLLTKAVIASRRLLGIVPFKDFQKHLLVLGPTRSGKTNTSKQAISMTPKRTVQVVILDWKAWGLRLSAARLSTDCGSVCGVASGMRGRRIGELPSHPPARGGEYNTIKGATVIRKINPWDVSRRTAKEKAAVAVELLREITRDIADVSSASAALLLRSWSSSTREVLPRHLT